MWSSQRSLAQILVSEQVLTENLATRMKRFAIPVLEEIFKIVLAKILK
jgi:hypothetical protein